MQSDNMLIESANSVRDNDLEDFVLNILMNVTY